jgi:hypothetical protein
MRRREFLGVLGGAATIQNSTVWGVVSNEWQIAGHHFDLI